MNFESQMLSFQFLKLFLHLLCNLQAEEMGQEGVYDLHCQIAVIFPLAFDDFS